MTQHPEAFASDYILEVAKPEITSQPATKKHDAAYMESLRTEFDTELQNLALGEGLSRPTGQNQDVPASVLFGVSRDKGQEANRTSANDFLWNLALEGDHASFIDIQTKRSPHDVLLPDRFDWLSAWTRKLYPDEESRHGFRGYNMYTDYAKSQKVVDWAHETLQGAANMDHDDIIPYLFRPEYEEDRRTLAPGFDTLSPAWQERTVNMLNSGFHLAQMNNGQALARSLEGFYALDRYSQEVQLNQALFDIGGAQGDTITNGSGTLTESMTRRLQGTIQIILSNEHAHLLPKDRALAVNRDILAFHEQRFQFGYDPNNEFPKPQAMVRAGMMFRDLTTEQIREIPEIFDQDFGEVTQALLLDFLNATGYEKGGSVWSMYGSTLAARFFSVSKRDGVPFRQAMAGSLRLLARINEAARRDIDVTDASMTNVVARDLMETLNYEGWRQFLTRPIKAEKFSPGQARVYLGQIPTFTRKRDDPRSSVQEVSRLEDLEIPLEDGYMFSAGGGGDAWVNAYVGKLLRQYNPVFIDPWGEKGKVEGAQSIGTNGDIFLAKPNTRLIGQRQTEDLLARRGLRVFLTCLERGQNGHSNLYDSLRKVIDHTGVEPSHISLVDTGGDITERSTLHDVRPSRDHLSLAAVARLATELSVRSETIISAIGVDAPEYLDEIVQSMTSPRVHDLTVEETALFQKRLRRDGLPSADPVRYSRMINALFYATHPQAMLHGRYAVQPLLLPIEQALKRRGARPATVALHPQMSSLLILDTVELANKIGVYPA